MFIDKVEINVVSGAGGNGMVAWRREKYIDMGGPAGGDGGKGGDVILVADSSISTLLDFKYKSIFKADFGTNGRTKNMHGHRGNDLRIKVPCGTIVRDAYTDKVIADLVEDGQEVLVAAGGRGGRGNARFVNSVRQAPQFCEPGEPGIERKIELELKTIADVGLLGMPNAGKSTLISVISAAKPKIANYPFTTLRPNLGVVRKQDGDAFVVADIPGLIEGASEGIGLGHEFLRHVERTKLLVHLVDCTSDDPVGNYHLINKELAKYSDRLANTFQVIVLNKIDSVDEETVNLIEEELLSENRDILKISAIAHIATQDLVNYLTLKVEEIPAPVLDIQVEEDNAAYDNDDSGYAIYKEKKVYVVEGGRIERLVSVTDLKNTEARIRLENILKSMDVFKGLKHAGIKDGDEVRIGSYEFYYYSGYFDDLEDNDKN